MDPGRQPLEPRESCGPRLPELFPAEPLHGLFLDPPEGQWDQQPLDKVVRVLGMPPALTSTGLCVQNGQSAPGKEADM